MPGKKKKYNARFPPARIKKIMQTDEEVGKVAAPVPVIISRALELFAETLLSRANDITTRRGARTLTPSHLKLCIETEGRFDFLRELVTNVPDLQEEEFEAEGDILPLQPRVSKPRSRGGIQAGGAPRERKSIDTVTQIPGSTQYMTQLHSNISTQSMVRGVGRKRGRPPKANGSNGPGRPVEKRKYVDDDDDDDVQVIDSSDDNSRESNGVIVANPIYSRGAESSAFIQIDPVEIRPSSFSSHSFHPSLQHSFSYSNSPKVTPSGQFQNLVSPESRDTPDKAALTRVSCLARSLSSPAFSGLPSGWDNKVGYYPGNKSDRKLLNTEDEMKKSSGPSFSSDELSSTNMSNGPSSTPTCTTSSATNGPKHSIGLHTHGTTSITDSGFYTSTSSSQSSSSSSVSQVSSIHLNGSNGFSTSTSTVSNPGLITLTPGALTTHSIDDKTGSVALTSVIIQPLLETSSPSFTISSLETSNLHKSSIAGGSNTFIPGGSNTSTPGGSSTSIPGGLNSSIPGGLNTSIPGGSNTFIPGGLNSSIPGGSNTSILGESNTSTCKGSNSTNLLTSTLLSTAQETCPRGLPLLDSGSHSFIRSLSSAQLSSASLGSGSRALAVKSKPLIRRDVIDEDYD